MFPHEVLVKPDVRSCLVDGEIQGAAGHGLAWRRGTVLDGSPTIGQAGASVASAADLAGLPPAWPRFAGGMAFLKLNCLKLNICEVGLSQKLAVLRLAGMVAATRDNVGQTH